MAIKIEEELRKSIIQEYENGASISQLSKKYPICYSRIRTLLAENKITIRGGRKKKELDKQTLQSLITDYSNGIKLKDLEVKYKLDEATIKRFMLEHGVERRNYNRVNKRIDSNYFSNIDSQEKAYWLGFLFTDGSVDCHGKSGRIRLQLQAQDKEILEKYKECLKLDSKIIDDIRPNSHCCSVEFVDNQIFNDLGKYGIIPNKTYLCKHIPYEKIPEQFQKDFARGLFDGDGSLSFSENCSSDVTFNFTSYYETVVQDFQILINKLIGNEKINKNFFTSAWHTQWRGRQQVLKILDILYKDSKVHLERKYKKYIKLKNSLN